MYYLQSRYYDPETGRFINSDDISLLGADGTFISFNLFAYCKNNPIVGFDPTGHFSWEKVFYVAAGVTIAAIAVAAIISTGGAAAPPLLAAASALAGATVTASAATTVATGVAIAGTVVMGTALTASILESTSKQTSRNQMQKQVDSGQAPKEVDHVDGPHIGTENQQNHIHFKDGTAINIDGTQSHAGNGVPKITNNILKWILKNGWGAPKF